MINDGPHIKFQNPFAKLSQPGDINLENLYKNFNIKLKKPDGAMSGFIDNHPYLRDTVHGLVSGATMALNYQDQNRMKKTQRDYLNDPFNLYETSSMKKYGSYPWLTSTGQFTDFPNEKVPVYEPGYQNSAYTNPMATAKKGGQLYMAFQGGGSTDQLGQMGNLPRYEMGAGSPIQNAIKMDSSHYGIPTAQKGGGFFTPEKLTDSTENYEYYEKPNNFLNYLKDMSANAVVQKALGKKRKGQLSESEEMGFAQMGMPAPQQAAQQTSQEQLMQMVAQALQQGATPEEVDQKLIEMGIPEEQAMQIVDAVVQQLQGAGQEQAQQEMPEEMPMAQMGMGMSGSDFQEFGFDNQNPLNPYYTGMYDPNEAKQANSQLLQGLYNSAQDAFSKPIAKAKQTNAEFYQNMQKLQDMIAKAEQPAIAKYGGMYQTEGAVNYNVQGVNTSNPRLYDYALEEYNFYKATPKAWQDDPAMTNEDGSLNLCLDCINIDWSNPEDVKDVHRLIEEGYSTGPHNEDTMNYFNTGLQNLGLQAPIYKSKQPKMKNGGIKRYQKKAIVKPTATDAAGFEKWYNETMGSLISDPNTKKEDIQAFMTMAGNWASDAKLDRNQLQETAQNPLIYTTQIPHKNSPGYATSTRKRMTRDNQDKYQQEYLDILKKFDTDYEVAAANNKIASSKNPNADPNVLRNLEAERDKAIQDLEKRYPSKVATDQDFFYSKPGTPAASTTTPGTTTNTTNTGGGGAGGYQFNPAMQQLLGAMAAGYTKTPLFGFRTKRNINALFNQAMADMMLKGQGQGTAGAAGTTVPGAPAVGPGANAQYNTWLKDNNINRYDITQGPNKFKMKIRANQPGQGIVQYDANGNLITTQNGDPSKSKNFDPFATQNFNPYSRGTTPEELTPNYTRLTSTFNPNIGYADKSFLEKARNRMATSRLQNLGSKLDQLNQKEQYLTDNEEKGYGPANLDAREFRQKNRMSNRYSKIANRFNKQSYTAPEHGFEMGGQYQQGGTYYLSDQEIQALINAGYELE